ncbi:MAG: nitroreductase family protein, partial [Acidobacteria bacterium]|nr:nitroreductase family protein [Acidobacteriota bacterium]
MRERNDHGEMTRRTFVRSAAAGVGGLALGDLVGSNIARAEAPGPLLPPITTNKSPEICLNSRLSYHSGLGGTATDQQISNVLWAAGKAPVSGAFRTIYLKTANATYVYHPEDHSLEFYSTQTVANAMRLDYDRELDFDMGVSCIFALMESVSLWTGTASQLRSCPQQADLNFGVGTVGGLTSKLVAVSSDGTLPSPQTTGTAKLEEVLAGLTLASQFSPGNLTPAQLSQLLWAGYGCTPHWTSNGRGGLTVPSWVAEYFLTGRIYVVQDKVSRFCNRRGTDLATRDHRLELVQDADVRAGVRQAVPGLPEAPCYVLLCLNQSGLGTWYCRLETGFVAGAMLVQAAAAGLGCHFRVPLSPQEQADLQQVTHIPAGDYPHAVVAIGGIPSPVDLRVSKEAGQTRLDWNGGTPPYRILRSESSDFSD